MLSAATGLKFLRLNCLRMQFLICHFWWLHSVRMRLYELTSKGIGCEQKIPSSWLRNWWLIDPLSFAILHVIAIFYLFFFCGQNGFFQKTSRAWNAFVLFQLTIGETSPYSIIFIIIYTIIKYEISVDMSLFKLFLNFHFFCWQTVMLCESTNRIRVTVSTCIGWDQETG